MEGERRGAKHVAIFEGEAKVGQIMGGMVNIQLTPEDFSSPLSLQMALSRIYEAVIKMFEEGPKKRYVAEVRFTDSMGNPVVVAVDLGESPPPFTRDKVRARITIELFEEEGEEGESGGEAIPP